MSLSAIMFEPVPFSVDIRQRRHIVINKQDFVRTFLTNVVNLNATSE